MCQYQVCHKSVIIWVSPLIINLSYYLSISEKLRWPVLVIAILAAVVGSQAIITGTFSIIKQCSALGCFPKVKIVHTSSKIHGQIYIPEINWTLMLLCLAVTIGLGTPSGWEMQQVLFSTVGKPPSEYLFEWTLRLHYQFDLSFCPLYENLRNNVLLVQIRFIHLNVLLPSSSTNSISLP